VNPSAVTNLRRRAFQVLEEWFHAKEACVVKPQHVLVTVQEMHLADGEGSVRATQKRSGRGFPPIRDLPRQYRVINDIIVFIGEVNPAWRRALELHCEHGSVRKAAKAIEKDESQHGKITAQLWRQFDQGLAVLQAEIVRQRI
jgi:hypothetical protein